MLKKIIMIGLFSFSTMLSARSKFKDASTLDVIPLNSPVKESIARFSLKIPKDIEVQEIRYLVLSSRNRFIKKNLIYEVVKVPNGVVSKELQIPVSKLKPGFYQLYLTLVDRKKKSHAFHTKYIDYTKFIIDNSHQVPIPNEKENNKTVAGIDSDGDGIRDDVQRWIDERYSARPKIKLGVKQVATSLQMELTNIGNRGQSIIASSKMLDDATCLDYLVGIDESSKIVNEIKSKLLNTKDRLNADIKSNANFSGQGWSSPSTPGEEKALCDFDPDKM